MSFQYLSEVGFKIAKDLEKTNQLLEQALNKADEVIAAQQRLIELQDKTIQRLTDILIKI